MSCDDVRELLEAYTLGVLEQDEHARVEAHLASCTGCRTLVAQYAEVLAGLPEALALASPLRLPETIKPPLLVAIEGAHRTSARPPTASSSRIPG